MRRIAQPSARSPPAAQRGARAAPPACTGDGSRPGSWCDSVHENCRGHKSKQPTQPQWASAPCGPGAAQNEPVHTRCRKSHTGAVAVHRRPPASAKRATHTLESVTQRALKAPRSKPGRKGASPPASLRETDGAAARPCRCRSRRD